MQWLVYLEKIWSLKAIFHLQPLLDDITSIRRLVLFEDQIHIPFTINITLASICEKSICFGWFMAFFMGRNNVPPALHSSYILKPYTILGFNEDYTSENI